MSLDPFKLLPKGDAGPQNVFRFYDNGGKTFDRYTIVIGKDVFGMSHNPRSPQGFNQYAGNLATDYPKRLGFDKSIGHRIKWADLPFEVQEAIKERANMDVPSRKHW